VGYLLVLFLCGGGGNLIFFVWGGVAFLCFVWILVGWRMTCEKV